MRLLMTSVVPFEPVPPHVAQTLAVPWNAFQPVPPQTSQFFFVPVMLLVSLPLLSHQAQGLLVSEVSFAE